MRKIIALFLSIVIIFSCCGVIASAAYEESLTFDTCIEGSWIIDVKGNSVISSKAPSYFYQLGDSEASLGYLCYDYLDDAQKYVYDAVVANVGKLSFTINFPNNLYAFADFNTQYLNEIMYAICTDRPDIFYYAGHSISGGTLHSNGEYLRTLNYNVLCYDSSYYTSSNVQGYYNNLMSALAQVPVDLSNRYNFIKSVHDYLAETIYYPNLDSLDYQMSAHDAYGALVEGRAVCQGYSDAIKLLCDHYNIPCVCIPGTSNGGGHMWNAVQMDDGKWYFIDCTWDDQESRTYYDFFLVGSQSTNTYFGGLAFSKEHVNDTDMPMPLPLLDYATNAYNRNQNHNTGFGSTHNSYGDDVTNTLYLSVFDVASSNVYYNGIYVDIPYLLNGETFTAPSGSSSQNEWWTLIVLGDANYDGVCDDMDYSASVNIALSNDNSAGASNEKACDINVDGFVDALDVAQIAQAASGSRDNFILA
jgi:hypothetical protein